MSPITLFRMIISLFIVVFGWMSCKISIIGFDGCNLKNLTVGIPIWRKILRKFNRYLSCILLWSLGVHTYQYKKLSYKDLYQLYGYKRPDIQSINDPNYNKEPSSYVIVSNHLGYLDILLYLSHFNGSFVAANYIRFVKFIGDIAVCFQSLFLQKGVKLSEQILQRVNLSHDTHDARKCNGCYLCSAKLIIFPEGTTTNSKQCLLPFRSSIFRSGKPIQPIIVRTPYKHFNTTWESIPFYYHLFRTYTQVYNDMKVIQAPPYIPSKPEIDDPYLYSFNVNKLMCKMLGNHYCVYLLNRDHKKECYHKYLLGQFDEKQALNKGKEIFDNDLLIQRYLQFIHIEGANVAES